MTAPTESEAYVDASTDSKKQSQFYLSPKSRTWVVAVSLISMICASLYAVFQPLNTHPLDGRRLNWIWYPIESNAASRLQTVHCADNYACRLNSVAFTASAGEAWAVGNVGLVLHRTHEQGKWEQAIINVTEEAASSPPNPPSQSATRAVPRAKFPASVQSAAVPNLIGMSFQLAEKEAYASGFQLAVDPKSSIDWNPTAQQAPPADLIIIGQSPAAKTLAAPKSVIRVMLGHRAKSAAQLLLERLVPSVYAAEARPRPVNQQDQSLKSGAKKTLPRSRSPSTGLAENSKAAESSALNDDLIYIGCSSAGCAAMGRSGRIYKISDTEQWTFKQASFVSSTGTPLTDLSLVSVDSGGVVIANSDHANYVCTPGTTLWLSDVNKPFTCSDALSKLTTKHNEIVLAANQIEGSDHAILERKQIGANNGNELLVGDSGFIAKLVAAQYPNSAENKPISSGTTATLRSSAFVSNSGLVVGDHGTILSSTDGGETWRHETQGQEGAIPNRRFPAGWYWVVSVFCIVTCSVAILMPAAPPPTEISVADWTVTDAPLKPGDLDSLDITPMALGLSRFIRNRKTQPPVTIAIEGEWGQGKSSVMSLLRADLQKSRFRPVWFNAWHHQSEEQLLAALLEHVKSQGVPPWWHIDNWIFRARLLWIRFRQKWPLMLALVLALCASIAYEVAHHGVRLGEVAQLGPGVVDLIKSFLPRSKKTFDLGHFGLLATIFAIFASVLQRARTFGIDPAKLTDNLRKATTIKDIKPDPGIRRQFAREFGDLCAAWSWGGRRVIIFIDDLDRCRPESVVTVLESINFLTSAGDCLVVLGIAQNQVTHCVGLGFKDIAESEEAYRGGGLTEQQKAVARFNYGSLYIKKLVNIVARLPITTEEQRRRILEMKASAVRREDKQQRSSASAAWRDRLWEAVSGMGAVFFKTVPLLALAATILLSIVAGYQQGQGQRQAEVQISPAPEITQTAGESLPGIAQMKSKGVKPLLYHAPTSQRATLSDSLSHVAEAWWSYAADGCLFFVLLGLLAYQLSARTNQDAQNSPEFEESLKLWGRYIVGVCDTPREIKRALNDLRYQAMTRRNNGPSITRAERMVRVLRQFVTGHSNKPEAAMSVDESVLPPRKAAELANLTKQEWSYFLDPDQKEIQASESLKLLLELRKEHIERFKTWINDTKPADRESSDRPDLSAQAARHG